MKDIPRFGATLTLVALIAAGSLAWINEITKPKILAQQERALNEALTKVLPGASQENIIAVKNEQGIIDYYVGYASSDHDIIIGYAFPVFSQGYSSIIRTLAGMDTTGSVLAIKVLFQQETPGLGTRCEEIREGESEPWWQHQFKGLEATTLAVDKDGGKITSITGATITSKAITDGIMAEAQKVLQLIEGNTGMNTETNTGTNTGVNTGTNTGVKVGANQ
jgi:electron transport complex protein RnfG